MWRLNHHPGVCQKRGSSSSIFGPTLIHPWTDFVAKRSERKGWIWCSHTFIWKSDPSFFQLNSNFLKNSHKHCLVNKYNKHLCKFDSLTQKQYDKLHWNCMKKTFKKTFEMEAKTTTLLSTCFNIISMHWFCCWNLLKKKFVKGGPSETILTLPWSIHGKISGPTRGVCENILPSIWKIENLETNKMFISLKTKL